MPNLGHLAGYQSISGKPQQGVGLNLNHPLLKDKLFCLYGLQEKGGQPKCLNNSLLDMNTGNGTPDWHPGDPDFRFYNKAEAETDRIAMPAGVDANGELSQTIFAVARCHEDGHIFSVDGPGDGGGHRHIRLTFEPTTTTFSCRSGANNASLINVAAPGFGADSKWHNIVGQLRKTDFNMYKGVIWVDGVAYGSEVEELLASFTLDKSISIATNEQDSAPNLVPATVDVALCGLVLRVWNDSEIRDWSQDPWQFFNRPVIDPAVFMDTAVVGDINTENKRRSVWGAGLPWMRMPAVPDGTIAAPDRAQMRVYSGISIAGAPAGGNLLLTDPHRMEHEL